MRLKGGLRGTLAGVKRKIVVGVVAAVAAVVRGGVVLRGSFGRGHKNKNGWGSSSSSRSGTNRNVDVSNIICLTARVFDLKKKAGGSRGHSPPGGLGGGTPIWKLFNISGRFQGLRGELKGGFKG